MKTPKFVRRNPITVGYLAAIATATFVLQVIELVKEIIH